MFFVASKVLGFLSLPSNLLLILGLAGVLMIAVRKTCAGLSCLLGTVLLLAVCGLSPLGNLLMVVLEDRFPPWSAAGGELLLEEVDIFRQSRTPEFLAKNSSGGVPVLELDDESHLSESVAICRYLEGLHPKPNLLGRNLREQVEIERWNRRIKLELFAAIGRMIQNTSSVFQGRFKQFPDYGEAQRVIVHQRLRCQQLTFQASALYGAGHVLQATDPRDWPQIWNGIQIISRRDVQVSGATLPLKLGPFPQAYFWCC
jgi:Glutathione S-transferase, N-terminal domain